MISIYRVVCEQELADILATGQLRTAKNSVEGKYFTGSIEEADDLRLSFIPNLV